MEREKIFSLTNKDFKIDYYRGTGKGGQKRNKTSSACRITHMKTGISASCEDGRSQYQNKMTAFKRLCDNEKFKKWIKIEAMRKIGQLETKEQIEKRINEMLKRDLLNGNIKVEEI